MSRKILYTEKQDSWMVDPYDDWNAPGEGREPSEISFAIHAVYTPCVTAQVVRSPILATRTSFVPSKHARCVSGIFPRTVSQCVAYRALHIL